MNRNDHPSRPSLAVNLMIMLVTFALLFSLIEAGLHVLHAIARVPAEEVLYEYDPLLGWKTKPNLNTVLVREGRKIPFITNSKGLRGPETPYERTPGQPRILILGKSFAQAQQVAQEELFSEKLKEQLSREMSRPLEVINAGTAGQSTDQQLLFFRTEGKRYSPDLTILMFHDNDIWYNNQDFFFDRPKPHFKVAGDQLELRAYPVPKTPPAAERLEVKKYPLWTLQGFKQWMGGHCYLYQFLRKHVRENPALFRLAAAMGISGKDLKDVPDDFRAWKRRRDADMNDAWIMTERILLQLKKEVEATGSQFVVYYVPNRAAVVPEDWNATKLRYGFKDAEWDVNQIASDIKALCSKDQIALIEPTADFIQAEKAASPHRQPLYYAIDSHWTPAGHEVTAQTMAGWIEKNSVLGKGKK